MWCRLNQKSKVRRFNNNNINNNIMMTGKSQSDSSGVACHCKDYLWMKETVVTSTGCRLECKEYGLSLTIPEGAVAKSQKEPILFALLQDEYKPILSGNYILTYIIYNYVFDWGDVILFDILYNIIYTIVHFINLWDKWTHIGYYNTYTSNSNRLLW